MKIILIESPRPLYCDDILILQMLCQHLNNFSPLIGVVIGAILGFFGSWLVGRQAHKNNLQRDESERLQKIDGVLLAIKSEIQVMSKFYEGEIGPAVKAIKSGQSFNIRFHSEKEFLIVYSRNTDLVGQIKDSDLVEAIVTTYNLANLLLEAFLMNNHYLEQVRTGIGVNAAFNSNMISIAYKIKQRDAELNVQSAKLLNQIDEYRKRFQV